MNDKPLERKGIQGIFLDDLLVYFGGCYTDVKCFNDLIAFDLVGKTWSTLSAGGTPPTPREGYCAVLHGTKLVVIGGADDSGYRNDVHIFDFEIVLPCIRFHDLFRAHGQRKLSRAQFQLLARITDVSWTPGVG